MTQQNLFDQEPPGKLPFRRGSTTSRQAAALAKPYANRQLRRVYDYFVGRKDDGATDEECQIATGLAGDSQRPRRAWLSEHGYLSESENMRLTAKGRPAVVRVWTGKVLQPAVITAPANAEQPQGVPQNV